MTSIFLYPFLRQEKQTLEESYGRVQEALRAANKQVSLPNVVWYILGYMKSPLRAYKSYGCKRKKKKLMKLRLWRNYTSTFHGVSIQFVWWVMCQTDFSLSHCRYYYTSNECQCQFHVNFSNMNNDMSWKIGHSIQWRETELTRTLSISMNEIILVILLQE